MHFSLDRTALTNKCFDCLHGFLYIKIINGIADGFILNRGDVLSLQDCSSIRLNKRHMNQIIIKDRIFGCLSGGAYCYFAMPVILKNATLEQQVERFFLVTTEKIILIKQGIEQEIRFETAT